MSLAPAGIVRSVRVVPDTLRLERRDTVVATCEPRNGLDGKGALLTTPCSWSLSRPAKASLLRVSNRITKVIAKDTGFTLITATAKTKKGQGKVAVVLSIPNSPEGPALFDTTFSILPATDTLTGAADRVTLQAYLRDPITGPMLAPVTWTLSNSNVVQPITSTKPAVTVIPIADGTVYVRGQVGATRTAPSFGLRACRR